MAGNGRNCICIASPIHVLKSVVLSAHNLVLNTLTCLKLVCVIGHANELLGWFHKRILPKLFIGKMLVRKHGYEIEGFRAYV